MKRVTLKTAELAKEKGFTKPCLFSWDYLKDTEWVASQRMITYSGGWTSNIYREGNAPAILLPSQSQLHKWLRDEHNCLIEVTFYSPKDGGEIKSKEDIHCYTLPQ